MKTSYAFFAAVIFTLLSSEHYIPAAVPQTVMEIGDGVVPIGKQYISPNKHYSVSVGSSDDSDCFIIKDLKTGYFDKSITIETLALYIHWNTDSQSFITIMHIAGGKYATIIYRQNGKWASTDYEPPNLGNPDKGIFEDYDISKLKFSPNEVHIIYTIYFKPETANEDVPGYKLCDIEVSLQTFKVINTKIMPYKE